MSNPFARQVWVTVGIVGLAAFLGYTVVRLADILLLVFAAILFGIFLNGPSAWLVRRTRLKRGFAVLIVLAILLVLLAGFVMLVGSTIADQVKNLGEQFPKAIEDLRAYLQARNWGRVVLSRAFPAGSTMSLSSWVARLTGAFNSVLAAVGSVFFMVILGVYLAMNPMAYIDNLAGLLPRERREPFKAFLRRVGEALGRWILGTLLSMVIVGTLITILTSIGGLPLPFALGFLAGLLEFIPYIGPWISAIPAILLAFTISPAKVVYAAVIYFVVQNLEGYLITPVVQSRVASMPPALLIAAQIIMGYWAGILGVLLATPLAVALIILIQQTHDRDFFRERVGIIGQ